MKNVCKKTLAFLLCVWMVCTMGIACFAGSGEKPYEVPESIKLSATSLSMLYGGTASLTATIYPEGADSRVIWKSSDMTVVQVDAYGNLTASKDTADTPSGKKTVTITATSAVKSSVSATCTVTVDNDTTTKLSAILKSVLAALKSVIAALSDPSKEIGKQLIEFAKQLLEMLGVKI